MLMDMHLNCEGVVIGDLNSFASVGLTLPVFHCDDNVVAVNTWDYNNTVPTNSIGAIHLRSECISEVCPDNKKIRENNGGLRDDLDGQTPPINRLVDVKCVPWSKGERLAQEATVRQEYSKDILARGQSRKCQASIATEWSRTNSVHPDQFSANGRAIAVLR
jgi:hypothetical protein